jgi:AcrR family transcriptional regulator
VPKVVDHDARRQELAEATRRVVRRAGVEGATVRAVAAEAGWSPGSLRYYFPAQSELFAFAMELVVDRVRERISALEPAGEVRAAVERALEQVLPLDAERKMEMEVWLAFWARAQADAALRAQRDETHRALRLFVRRSLVALAEAGLMPSERSLEVETSRLHALLDGLALHGVTSSETTTPRRMRAALRAHLDALAVAQPADASSDRRRSKDGPSH